MTESDQKTKEIRRYYADEAALDDSMLFIAERDHDKEIRRLQGLIDSQALEIAEKKTALIGQALEIATARKFAEDLRFRLAAMVVGDVHNAEQRRNEWAQANALLPWKSSDQGETK